MSNPKQIDHEGTILEIMDGKITVGIVNVSACAGCHAKGACTMSDMKEKSIDVIDYSNKFSVGEKVRLTYRESLGWFALMLAYVIPFVLVLLVLFIATAFTNDELISGLLSLAILPPYYIILSFFKGRLKKTFSFTIEKIVNI
ncbi:SoxR reducing system RseC family protein [Marinifilum fragile]|uniref:SoxR reducing system RseC family protein n=1 Tax=Marinifilum fragile TaxID=570161 RepID=UPI002AA932D5|nr:SoxR reducing system RseC family protein [Marinifilum fragile]